MGTLVLRSIRSQAKVQVVACRLRIAKVELHGLAFLNDVSDRDGSGLLIRSNEVPNEEVAPLEMTPVLIDHDAQMQRAVRIAALGSPWIRRRPGAVSRPRRRPIHRSGFAPLSSRQTVRRSDGSLARSRFARRSVR